LAEDDALAGQDLTAGSLIRQWTWFGAQANPRDLHGGPARGPGLVSLPVKNQIEFDCWHVPSRLCPGYRSPLISGRGFFFDVLTDKKIDPAATPVVLGHSCPRRCKAEAGTRDLTRAFYCESKRGKVAYSPLICIQKTYDDVCTPLRPTFLMN
jgi:hypothetical protein